MCGGCTLPGLTAHTGAGARPPGLRLAQTPETFKRLGAQTLPPLRPWASPRSRIHRTVGSRRQGALPVSIMRPEHRALASPSSAGVQGCLGLSFHPHTPWRKGVPCSPPHGPFQLHRARSTASRKALETKTTASQEGGKPGSRTPGREKGEEPGK